jgi:glycine cleavage system H protein
MSSTPDDLKYTKDHEWVRDNGDGTVTVGITDHAQESLGDLVFIELPEVGRQVESAEACAVVESVKAASDIYSPADGEVTEINDGLGDAPESINEDPYGEGWIYKLRLSNPAQVAGLLDAAGYEALVAEEA